ITAIPVIVVGMLGIRRHYLGVADRLRLVGEPAMPRANRVFVLASHTGRATQRAIEYAEMIRPETINVVHVREPGDDDLLDTWDRLYPDHPLRLIDADDGRPFRSLRDVVQREAASHLDSFITVIIPELVRRRRLGSLLVHPHGIVVKLLLLFVPRVVVTDLTYQRRQSRSTDVIRDPDHIVSQQVIVLTSDVTIPVRRALGYVKLLNAPRVVAAHLDTDADQRDRILRNWDPDFGELQILESPYRGLTKPLVRYVRRLRRDAEPGVLIHVVIPEFVVPGFWSQILHNQTAFAIKASMIFEPGVAVTSIPWHLASAPNHNERTPSNGPEPIQAATAPDIARADGGDATPA
ncbi:MAG TPA: hypothetical protein VJQ79_10385, partial [Acidimicrobiia bacterium]|nr:hypothetical protein [Acidimicrobiia bacterium]